MQRKFTAEIAGDVGTVPTSPTCSYFTDMELQWFQGGVRVADVVHEITSSDIVSIFITRTHINALLNTK